MKRKILVIMRAFFLPVMGLLIFVQTGSGQGAYPDPSRFESSVLAFERADSLRMPTAGAIVCTGSSSMRKWHGKIREDLAPLTIIPRGFGGSNMNDLLYYTDRIVLRYKPRAVVVYEGDNDIAQQISPGMITETFRSFVRKVHRSLPDCRIYFISIKPSIARWKLWPEMEKTNRMIDALCDKDPRLIYIDVASGMLDEKGQPFQEIFVSDSLHMNRKGYLIWRKIIRPVLVREELRFEPKHTF